MTSETVILSSPAKWKQWISIIRAQCDTAEIWEYVNPSKSTDDKSTKICEPEDPTIPPEMDDEAAWTTRKQYEWQRTLIKDKELHAVWKRKSDAIRNLRLHIYKTIAEDYLPFTVDDTDKSVHKLLINLKN
jgi:hypothetical protein